MTELRQKMIRAMELANLSDNTQRRYLGNLGDDVDYLDQFNEIEVTQCICDIDYFT